MKSVCRMALMVALCLMMSGCFGGVPPREEFLRLPLTACGACGEAGPVSGAPVVAVKGVSALPALERSAVMVADGRVLTPSVSLYWEGAPAEIVERGLAGCLGCAGLAPVWPYSPRVEHDAVLTGHVEAFEVQTRGERRFVLGVRLELWSKRSKALVADRVFHVERSIDSPRAQAIAEAADGAMAELMAEAGKWAAEVLGR